MYDFVPLLSGIGIGAILQSVVQHWLSSKKYIREREFKEKKDAYVGLLLAIHESHVKQTPEAALNVGHWISVCELFASDEVKQKCRQLLATNPVNGEVHPDRPALLEQMKMAMKLDLERT